MGVILDYLIVMALAGLFVPYPGPRDRLGGLTDEPWDTVVGVLVILTVGALRTARRTSLYRTAILVRGRARLAPPADRARVRSSSRRMP